MIEKENNTTREFTYGYDNVGNRISVSRTVNGKFKDVQEWKNNADNQLVEIQSDKGATFEYDENGHIKQKNGAFGEVITYHYDAEGRLIEEVSNSGIVIGYYYDGLGNRIAKGISNEYNRRIKTDLKEWMKGVDREAQLRLSYEDVTLGEALEVKQPFQKLPNGKKYWRIDHSQKRRKLQEEKLKKEVSKDVSIDVIQYINDYTQEFTSPIQQAHTSYDKKVKKTKNIALFYDDNGQAVGDDLDVYHHDGLGSNITQSEKATGKLYSSNAYEVFGRSERPIYEQMGYRSQYHDNWKNLHLRAREYDTTTGKFKQEDIILGDLNKPVTQNKYIYGNNNPFIYRDDGGRFAWVSKAWNTVKSVAKKVVNAVVEVAKTVVNTVSKVF